MLINENFILQKEKLQNFLLELQGCEAKRVTVYCWDTNATWLLEAKRTTDWVFLPVQKESSVNMLTYENWLFRPLPRFRSRISDNGVGAICNPVLTLSSIAENLNLRYLQIYIYKFI